jgi:hypothetical protein
MSVFLDDADLVKLTGFKTSRRQIDQLRKMGLPFFVNAASRPVVAVAAVSGPPPSPSPRKKVVPPSLMGAEEREAWNRQRGRVGNA